MGKYWNAQFAQGLVKIDSETISRWSERVTSFLKLERFVNGPQLAIGGFLGAQFEL